MCKKYSMTTQRAISSSHFLGGNKMRQYFIKLFLQNRISYKKKLWGSRNLKYLHTFYTFRIELSKSCVDISTVKRDHTTFCPANSVVTAKWSVKIQFQKRCLLILLLIPDKYNEYFRSAYRTIWPLFIYD